MWKKHQLFKCCFYQPYYKKKSFVYEPGGHCAARISCTPLEGVWSLLNTINLHGGHSDQLSTIFILCTDIHTELSGNVMKQVGEIKRCRKYRWVTCPYSPQDWKNNCVRTLDVSDNCIHSAFMQDCPRLTTYAISSHSLLIQTALW